MSDTQKPMALILAEKYEIEGFLGDHRFAQELWCRQAAAELRSLHAENLQLHEQMAAIGAGGVEPLRKQASTADMQVTNTTMHGLEQFIEQVQDVHFQRCRVGSKEGAIRWDIEFGRYGAEVRGKTLREAITKAIAAQAKQGAKK